MKIQFKSDYCEGALPQVMERLVETNMAQTVGYGEDEFCAEARKTIQALCCPGHESDADVHFLVGGTQTNTTVISAMLRPHQGVICAASGHINVHETGSVEHSGHKCLPLSPTDGKISASQIDQAVTDHYADSNFEHTIQPAMVYISFPTELGTIYSKQELQDISAVCKKHDIPLFIDGARLGYGLAASPDLTIQDIAEYSDVFYIGGTKQGALFGEAVVITKDCLKKDFRYHIKQGGGMLAKGRLLGIQFQTLLSGGLYQESSERAVKLAKRIRQAFEAKGCSFLVDSPTNQQFPVLANDKLAEFDKNFGYEIWAKVDENHTGVRFCTSWATKEENVEILLKAIDEIL